MAVRFRFLVVLSWLYDFFIVNVTSGITSVNDQVNRDATSDFACADTPVFCDALRLRNG